MSRERMLRLALGLELLGVILESVSIMKTTPVTFMIFVGVALPCMLGGVLVYLAYLFRVLWQSEQNSASSTPRG